MLHHVIWLLEGLLPKKVFLFRHSRLDSIKMSTESSTTTFDRSRRNYFSTSATKAFASIQSSPQFSARRTTPARIFTWRHNRLASLSGADMNVVLLPQTNVLNAAFRFNSFNFASAARVAVWSHFNSWNLWEAHFCGLFHVKTFESSFQSRKNLCWAVLILIMMSVGREVGIRWPWPPWIKKFDIFLLNF